MSETGDIVPLSHTHTEASPLGGRTVINISHLHVVTNHGLFPTSGAPVEPTVVESEQMDP